MEVIEIKKDNLHLLEGSKIDRCSVTTFTGIPCIEMLSEKGNKRFVLLIGLGFTFLSEQKLKEGKE